MSEEINKNEAEKEEATVNTEESTASVKKSDDEVIGNIKVSVHVVSTIAGIAASEIKGVAGMYSTFAGGIAERFGAKKNQSKGVKVEMSETSVLIDLYLVVEYGVRIPELAWEIQDSVKNNVETMTGLEVQKVNIHIEGVSFAKAEEAAAQIPQDEVIEIEEESGTEQKEESEDIND